jgi:hypothetical protein
VKYLLLLYNPEGDRPHPGSPEGRQLYEEYRQVTATMAQSKVLLDSAPLEPDSSATTVRVRQGKTMLTDGPAAEIKEWLGGYTLIECEDLDAALSWAAKIPAARDACVVIRPLSPMPARS